MEKKIFYLCDGEVEKCRRKSGCYKNGGGCMHTSDVEHAKNFEEVRKGGFYENITIPGSQAWKFLEQFSKKPEEKVIKGKVILEGTKEYFENVQKMKQETKNLDDINKKLNETLESQIGIIKKLRGQEEARGK